MSAAIQTRTLYSATYLAEISGLDEQLLTSMEDQHGWPRSYSRQRDHARLYDPEDLADLQRLKRLLASGHALDSLIQQGQPVWHDGHSNPEGGDPSHPDSVGIFTTRRYQRHQRQAQPTTVAGIDHLNQVLAAIEIRNWPHLADLVKRGAATLSPTDLLRGVIYPIAMHLASNHGTQTGLPDELRAVCMTIDTVCRQTALRMSTVTPKVTIRKPPLHHLPLAHAMCIALRLRKVTASLSLSHGLRLRVSNGTRTRTYLADTIPTERLLDPRTPLPRAKLGL